MKATDILEPLLQLFNQIYKTELCHFCTRLFNSQFYVVDSWCSVAPTQTDASFIMARVMSVQTVLREALNAQSN